MISLSAPWGPDRYDYQNGRIVTEAKGVLPGPTSYIPWPSLSALSVALATGYCRGAVLARTTSGSYVIFAGTATRLYKYVSATDAWTNVTRLAGGDYAVPDDEQWSFAQFGDNLVVVNATDDPQVIDIGSGSNFAALGGSPPKARYAKVVGDQLWLGGLALNPNRVMWSGRNDIEHWTVGTKDCDYQEFPDGGFVTGITTLETGLITQEGAIRRYAADPGRAIYQFAKVEDQRGCLAPASLVVPGRVALYYSEDGFYVTDGAGSSAPIGNDFVDGWFGDQVNTERLYSIIGAIDPTHPRVSWLFPTAGNTTALLDHIICYDLAQKQWSHAEVSASYIFGAATAGYTLEGLDVLGYTLDTMPFSLDSRLLMGGAPSLAAFDSAYKLAFFSGSNMAAQIKTAGLQLIPGQRSFVQGCHVYTDASAATITINKKESVQDAAYTAGTAVAINSQGFTPQRSSGRIHQFQLDIAAAATWQHIQGLDPIYESDGER